MLVREATNEDLPWLVTLNNVVHELHISFNVGIFKSTTDKNVLDWFKSVVSDEKIVIYVALIDAQVAGYIMARKSSLPENIFLYARKSIYIEQVAVDEAYRGRGIFSALMNEVINLTKSEGYGKVQLDVWTKNIESKNIFEHIGFQTYNEKMELLV